MLNLIRDALRLAQLTIAARLAVLEIETTGITELTKMDQTQYTVGQVVFLNDVQTAVNGLRITDSDIEPEPTDLVETVNGPFPYKDIPRNADGNIAEDWLAANCTCDDHEKGRIDKDNDLKSQTSGMYL